MKDFSLRLPVSMPAADKEAWAKENKYGLNKQVSFHFDDSGRISLPANVLRETSYVVTDNSMTTKQRVVNNSGK